MMIGSIRGLIAIVAAGLCTAAARSAVGDRVVAILDDGSPRAQYSDFFKSLTERGFNVEYTQPKDGRGLFELGERAFDHAILFPQKSKGLGPQLTPQELSRFVQAGGNLLIGASSTASAAVKELARELDIDLAERGSFMVDHFNYDTASDDGKHTSVLSARFTTNAAVLSDDVRNGPPVVFRGVGHTLGNGELLVPILGSSSTAYSYESGEDLEATETPWVAGSQAGLVSGFQARNNARVAVAGSVEMFSNAAFGNKTFGNRLFARDLTAWAFQERGVIRSQDLYHGLATDGPKPGDDLPTTYSLKNEVNFGISLQQWDGDKWTPYVASDVQLELIMLDPYIRVTLSDVQTSGDAARYAVTLKLPDHYGVFHFKVNYKRPGLTSIEDRSQVTIRHNRHNEYPRFLTAAYPYYSATAVTGAGFLGLCLLWLFGSDRDVSSKKKKQ